MNDQKTRLAASSSPSAERAKEILRTRARSLARPPADAQARMETLQVIEFRLAQERYAVEQAHVREVHPLRELTPLPCTPSFLPGIINVRGQILPAIDIRKFFDLPDAGIADMHVAIVVQHGDVEVGILADAVAGVRSIPLSVIQPPFATLTGVGAEYVKGVTEQGMVILDAVRILTDPRIVVNEEVRT